VLGSMRAEVYLRNLLFIDKITRATRKTTPKYSEGREFVEKMYLVVWKALLYVSCVLMPWQKERCPVFLFEAGLLILDPQLRCEVRKWLHDVHRSFVRAGVRSHIEDNYWLSTFHVVL
jgi:hypothetical protein